MKTFDEAWKKHGPEILSAADVDVNYDAQQYIQKWARLVLSTDLEFNYLCSELTIMFYRGILIGREMERP